MITTAQNSFMLLIYLLYLLSVRLMLANCCYVPNLLEQHTKVFVVGGINNCMHAYTVQPMDKLSLYVSVVVLSCMS